MRDSSHADDKRDDPSPAERSGPDIRQAALDPMVGALAELAALVDALAGQTPNGHAIQARVAALRARIDAL